MDPKDIQGNVVPGFRKKAQLIAGFVVNDAAKFKSWCSAYSGQICSTQDLTDSAFEGSVLTNVVFTARGLARLGMHSRVLAGGAFDQGAAVRSALLGEFFRPDEMSHPSRWHLTDDSHDGRAGVDGIFILGADDRVELIKRVTELRRDIAGAKLHGFPNQIPDVYELAGYLSNEKGPDQGREHFGFSDSLTNPILKSSFSTSKPAPLVPAVSIKGSNGREWANGRLYVEPDELLLDATHFYDDALATWFSGGSFVVFRRYRQFVGRFLNSIRYGRINSNFLAAQKCGRYADGRPLVVVDGGAVNLNSFNDFRYDGSAGVVFSDEGPIIVGTYPDLAGRLCPFSAHIRNVNPRDAVDLSDRPSILRRSLPYGAPANLEQSVQDIDRVDRGLHFLAYMSSIEKQFEALQRRMNGLVPCIDSDAMVGSRHEEVNRFVIVTAGLNGFSPSLHALREMHSL